MKVTILILFQVANDQSSKVKTFPSCGNWNFTWLCKPRIWNYRRWNMYEVIMKSEIISGQKWDLAADVSSAWLGPSLSQLNVSLQETVCKCDISDVLSLAMINDELMKISEGSEFCKNINLTQRELSFSAADGWCTFREVLEVVFIHTGNLLRIW